jgi:hypothetical protein
MSNGRYQIRSSWNEEDAYGFDNILEILRKFINPIIIKINAMGKAVIIGELLPLITCNNVSYTALNISIYWKKIILSTAFNWVREQFDDYVRARMMMPSAEGKIEFVWCAGMYEFDSSLIDKIMAPTNYYKYLSDPAVKVKWDQNYKGRAVQLVHRTSDTKFEIADIREHEFQTFYRYICVFVSFINKHTTFKQLMSAAPTTKATKRLKRLQEQDPELYNLKKYNGTQVYARFCQNIRQPLLYTDDEIAAMSVTDRKKLTQYHNFTFNRPAFYSCPNSKYPTMSYIVGHHPHGYCLPCCSKKIIDVGKRAVTNQICEKTHHYTKSNYATQDQPIKHILVYGKSLAPGRLSKLHRIYII